MVTVVVEKMILVGVRLAELVEVDGPSVETVTRWNEELTSIPVRERLQGLLPKSWLPSRKAVLRERAEQAYTWELAQALHDFLPLKLKAPITKLLQQVRLSLMQRYFTAH